MALLIIILIIYGLATVFKNTENINENVIDTLSEALIEEPIDIEYATEAPTYPKIDYPDNTGIIKPFGEDISSKSGVLINVTDNKIIAGNNVEKKIFPASMTKIMTLIVAAEKIESLDDTFTMTHEILAPLYDEQASTAGFQVGETVNMNDLLYGAALPSGADATVGLAIKLCGSENSFVDAMNQKALDMGLKNTHFCNTSGLHDEQHYTTPVEMAMIMEYAMKNDLCRQVLSAYQYTTSKTTFHPKGILLTSTMFSRMYGDEVVGAKIIAGKTGYTDEAQNCLATYGTKGGKEYVTVTSLSPDYWLIIHDAFNIYANYIEPKTEIVLRPE